MDQGIRKPMRSPSGHEIPDVIDPVLEELVRGIIAQVADKWTMLILEVLEEHGTLRFTQIGRLTDGIS